MVIKMREKRFLVEPEKNGLKKISAELRDEFHHIILRVWIESDQLRIVNIELNMLQYPAPKCIDIKENLRKLIGLPFQHPQFRRRLLKIIGGERGCFHVLELLVEAQDYARPYFWDHLPDENGCYKISPVNHEEKVRCIAFRNS